MKKLHLGRILFLITLPYLLLASSVKATLDKPLIYRGDTAVLSIKAEGDDVTFPALDTIAGYPVLGTAQSQSMTSINGNVSRFIQKSYTFAPTKSIVIPSMDVEVDGKKLSTKPLTLQVTTPKAAGKNAPVQLQMRLAKQEVYVGEPVRLDLIFKRAPNAKFAQVEIAEPEVKSFWAKKLPKSAPKTENGYITQTYSYLLFPQQSGEYTIPATFAKIGQAQQRRRNSMFNDPFFNDPFFSSVMGSQIRWKKLFSNDAKLKVLPLPDNLDVYGDFHIKADVDKTSTHANKPVNLTIMIEGEGNLDDIKKFDLDIPDAVVYADEPQIDASAQDGTYRGRFTQKIAIVADQNYTIPSISFSYFDKKSKSKKTIKTAPIPISVKGGHPAQMVNKVEEKPTLTATAPLLEKSQTASMPSSPNVTKTDANEKYLYLVAGLFLGGLLTYLGLYLSQRGFKRGVKKERSILQKVQRAKDDKSLFELLAPYANAHPVIKSTLTKLEKNIYRGGDEKIDKEDILEALEEI